MQDGSTAVVSRAGRENHSSAESFLPGSGPPSEEFLLGAFPCIDCWGSGGTPLLLDRTVSSLVLGVEGWAHHLDSLLLPKYFHSLLLRRCSLLTNDWASLLCTGTPFCCP